MCSPVHGAPTGPRYRPESLPKPRARPAQTWASGTLSLSRSRTHVARVQFCGRGVETGSALGWELPLSSAQLGPANSIDCTLRETEAWYHLAKGGRDVKGGQS